MPAVSGNVIGLATYVTNQALMRIIFALLVAIVTAFAIVIVLQLSCSVVTLAAIQVIKQRHLNVGG